SALLHAPFLAAMIVAEPLHCLSPHPCRALYPLPPKRPVNFTHLNLFPPHCDIRFWTFEIPDAMVFQYSLDALVYPTSLVARFLELLANDAHHFRADGGWEAKAFSSALRQNTFVVS